MALSRVVSEIFNVEKCRDREIGVRGHSRSSIYDTIQSGTHDFLLMLHNNHRPISYCFRDKRRFPSKIAKFFHSVYLTPPFKGFPLEFGIGARGHKNLNDGATRPLKNY